MDSVADAVVDKGVNWGEFAALGTVILFLFGILVWLIRTWITHQKDMQEKHVEERQNVHAEHAKERTEWKNYAERRDDRMEMVITRLTDAVRDQTQIFTRGAQPVYHQPPQQQMHPAPSVPPGTTTQHVAAAGVPIQPPTAAPLAAIQPQQQNKASGGPSANLRLRLE